jgi:hypothetical protein
MCMVLSTLWCMLPVIVFEGTFAVILFSSQHFCFFDRAE